MRKCLTFRFLVLGGLVLALIANVGAWFYAPGMFADVFERAFISGFLPTIAATFMIIIGADYAVEAVEDLAGRIKTRLQEGVPKEQSEHTPRDPRTPRAPATRR